MKHRKYLFLNSLFCLLTIFCCQSLIAQYDDLIDNPDITWIAEFSTDHKLSIDANPNEEVVQLIKYYNHKSLFENSNKDNWVMNWIVQGILKNNLDCYADPSLTLKLSEDRIEMIGSIVDTITTFSPETYKEQIRIIKTPISSDRIKSFRANQIIYFDQKTKRFDTRLISIAPLQQKGKLNSVPMFWIKMDEPIPNNLDILSNDINWAVISYSIDHPLEVNFLQEVKNSIGFEFKDRIYQQAINPEKVIYNSWNYGTQKRMSKQEILQVYNSVDTVTTFDPETYAEDVKIYNNSFSYQEISSYRLVQEWYYDQKKRKLMNRLIAICPLYRVSDANGKYRYTAPLYYINYRLSPQ